MGSGNTQTYGAPRVSPRVWGENENAPIARFGSAMKEDREFARVSLKACLLKQAEIRHRRQWTSTAANDWMNYTWDCPVERIPSLDRKHILICDLAIYEDEFGPFDGMS